MPTLVVTGAAGLIGQALLPRLTGDCKLVALDVRAAPGRLRGCDVRLVDVARSELEPVFRGADALVHLASVVDPVRDEGLMARVNVEGTRRVLEAASAVGIGKVVRVSGASVYGAWPSNPVPLRESDPVRPNPGYSSAVHAAEAERLLLEWGAERPDRITTTLRTAPVVGLGAERLPTRLMVERLRVRGCAPPVQAVYIDDLVDALELVIRVDHPGVFNVGADGWIDAEAASALLLRSFAPALPVGVMRRLLAATWHTGVGDVPPGIVPYLVHPWVVANDRLRALGWRPTRTNEEAIAAGVAAWSTARRGIVSRRRGAGRPRGRSPRSTDPSRA